MATRKETSTRKQALHEELRLACRNGTLPPGEPLPSVRDLAGRYSVSHRLVNEALRTLMQEGLLYSVPRQGTFVGSPNHSREAQFLLYSVLAVRSNDQLSRLQYGFEEQITRLGGTCLSVTREMARVMARGEVLRPAGVFFVGGAPEAEDLELFGESSHLVYFQDHKRAAVLRPGDGTRQEDGLAHIDRVSFDNVGGGHRATHYLLGQGHTRIAFLGLHAEAEPDGIFGWSRERAAGWARAMEETRHTTRGLLLVTDQMPPQFLQIDEQVETGYQVAKASLGKLGPDKASAVVATNVHSAHGLLRALRESCLPDTDWPAITTFGMGDGGASMMTTMLLPWEQMGRDAAELLWSRYRGTHEGAPRHVSVPMSLITRLTCRPQWNLRPEAALLGLEVGHRETTTA